MKNEDKLITTEYVNLTDIKDYINWYKSEFGQLPCLHLDEIIDIVEKKNELK